MILRELFESKAKSVGIIFGRFNPPHQGHKAAWEMASENLHWYVGTNKSTQGPKDPLPFDIKIKAMEAVWPEVKGHIVAETSWLTLASKVYEKYGNIVLNVYTDEDWVTKTLVQYNGKEGAHGYYEFGTIQQQLTPRLSSATALRAAVQAGDRDAFSQAAGVDADTPVAGHPFFDVVAHYLAPHAEKVAKKKVKDPVAEMDKSQPAHGRDGHVSHSTYGSRDKQSDAGGKEHYGKAVTAKKFAKDVLKTLNKTVKQAVAEDFGDEEAIGRTEPYGGIYIYLEDDGDEVFVQAMYKPAADGSTEMGYVTFEKQGKYLVPEELEVAEKYQRQGVATTMYDYVKSKGYKIKRSIDQTDDGAAFWDKQRPEQNVWEQGVAEGNSKAMDQTAKRLTDPKDGATAKLRAAGDKRREDQLKGRDMVKRDRTSKDAWGDLKENLNELSTELLGRYKTAAAADAQKADAEGNYKQGDKRFKGINKATIKQFDNDAKKHNDVEEMYKGHHRTMQHHLKQSQTPTKGVDTSAKKSARHHLQKEENAWDRLQREKAMECAGVGIITKQNSTVDVNKNTPKKNLKAFRLI